MHVQLSEDVDRTSERSCTEAAVLWAVLEVKRRGREESMGWCGRVDPLFLKGSDQHRLLCDSKIEAPIEGPTLEINVGGVQHIRPNNPPLSD